MNASALRRCGTTVTIGTNATIVRIVTIVTTVTTVAIASSGFIAGPVRADNPSAQAGTSMSSGVAALAAKADAARDAGRLDEARALYRKALAARPTWKEGWWSLATILYDQDAYAEAARAFRRVLAQDPKHGTAHLMLALCEYQLDRDASAMEHLQAAKALGVQKDEQLPQVLAYHEAMLLLRAGRYERAIEATRPLVAADVEEESLDLALGLGALLMRPKDAPPEGSPGLQIVLRAGRAERQSLAKQFPEAKEAYGALVRDAPTFPNVHYAYGRLLLATDDLDGAVAEFQQEIANNPAHVRAHMRIAAARYRVDSAAGIPSAQTVVKLQPDYPFGHYLLGLLHFDAGDIQRAIPELEAAARMIPDEPQFHFTLGNAYARAGRKEDAARERAAFLRLNGQETAAETPRLDLDHVGRTPSDRARPPGDRARQRPR